MSPSCFIVEAIIDTDTDCVGVGTALQRAQSGVAPNMADGILSYIRATFRLPFLLVELLENKPRPPFEQFPLQ